MCVMNCLTIDAHRQKSIHSGATFSSPAFSTLRVFHFCLVFFTSVFSIPAFSTPVILCRVFSYLFFQSRA